MGFNELKEKILSTLGQAAGDVKDFAGKAGDSAKNFAEKAADKAKTGGRIAKLSMELSNDRDEVKKIYQEIGRLYYDSRKENPEGFFAQLCEEVSVAEAKISEKEAELAELKASFGSSGEPDVSVDFEEIVEQDECAADAPKPEAAPDDDSKKIYYL